MGRIKIIIPKKLLKNLYWKKHMSSVKIAKLYLCDAMTVRTRIKEYGIPTRSVSDARMRYKKYDFSGNLIEKAYMIGFRLGDLNIYQTNKNSELIVARCNTTQKVQSELIKNIFSKYGKVTISPSIYSMHINCFLNKSFDFLLPKYKELPLWIEENKKTISSFIAGYTDAEGNFLLNQRKARFKIDSYDKQILFWIAEKLQNYGIKAKLRCINKKGKPYKNTPKFNNDVWRININEAISILHFIELIKQFSKHKTRLKHMTICEKNIKERIKNGTIKN